MGTRRAIDSPVGISLLSAPMGDKAASSGCMFFLSFFMAALGLCCCTQAFSSCGKQGLLFIAVCGLLIAAVSLAKTDTWAQ